MVDISREGVNQPDPEVGVEAGAPAGADGAEEVKVDAPEAGEEGFADANEEPQPGEPPEVVPVVAPKTPAKVKPVIPDEVFQNVQLTQKQVEIRNERY